MDFFCPQHMAPKKSGCVSLRPDKGRSDRGCFDRLLAAQEPVHMGNMRPGYMYNTLEGIFVAP